MKACGRSAACSGEENRCRSGIAPEYPAEWSSRSYIMLCYEWRNG